MGYGARRMEKRSNNTSWIERVDRAIPAGHPVMERLRKTPRISVVFDFLADRLKRRSSEQEARLARSGMESGS